MKSPRHKSIPQFVIFGEKRDSWIDGKVFNMQFDGIRLSEFGEFTILLVYSSV